MSAETSRAGTDLVEQATAENNLGYLKLVMAECKTAFFHARILLEKNICFSGKVGLKSMRLTIAEHPLTYIIIYFPSHAMKTRLFFSL